MKTYTIRKCRKILKSARETFLKKQSSLKPEAIQAMQQDLTELERAIDERDKKGATAAAKKVELFCDLHFTKSYFEYALEIFFALLFALIVATVIRQAWFELYEIPTGSMRPTFRELDRLTVTKTQFGINIPLQTNHFYFDPELIERTGVVIFSGDQIPIIDDTTNYFWLFPSKKRYIKRMIGKPGDTLYFYGGKIYGIDRDGAPIAELLDAPHMVNLEHIPMIHFFESAIRVNQSTFALPLMGQPFGLIKLFDDQSYGFIKDGDDWVQDQPYKESDASPHTYSDLFGIGNFGAVEIVRPEEVEKNVKSEAGDGVLYLKIRHHPSLTDLEFARTRYGSYLVRGHEETSYIPLQKHHLQSIMDNLYTSRFVIKNGYAHSFGSSGYSGRNPYFPDVENGTYEFYFGKAYKMSWGVNRELPADHPLNSRDPSHIMKLFNMGISFDKDALATRRYAYFRDGELYLLGKPVYYKDDPDLERFVSHEMKREDGGDYVPFVDQGPPESPEFIRKFGIKIPEKHYFVLGDNHSNSSDSRIFGFVPQENIQGRPSIIIWPPGNRLGKPAQLDYPIFVTPRLIIWAIAILALLTWYVIHKRNLRRQKEMIQKITEEQKK